MLTDKDVADKERTGFSVAYRHSDLCEETLAFRPYSLKNWNMRFWILLRQGVSSISLLWQGFSQTEEEDWLACTPPPQAIISLANQLNVSSRAGFYYTFRLIQSRQPSDRHEYLSLWPCRCAFWAWLKRKNTWLPICWCTVDISENTCLAPSLKEWINTATLSFSLAISLLLLSLAHFFFRLSSALSRCEAPLISWDFFTKGLLWLC